MNNMNSRQRFHETMHYGSPDRIPYFEEGIRAETLAVWRTQGMASDANLSKIFTADRREEFTLDVDPHPKPKKWPASRADLDGWRRGLDPDDPERWPADWPERVRVWRKRDHALMLRVHRGFFLTMGVNDWERFAEVIYLLMDDPDFVRQAMMIQGALTARLTERFLTEVDIDAVIFSEPIGGNDQSLISPKMYEDFVLTSYEPVLDALRRHKVETIIFRTYANARILIPSVLKWGFNCLWACEVDTAAMDYLDLRREFGRDLRLIGGIDLDTLRQGKEAIRREVEKIVPPLLADGGYVPLADGRVREDVPFEHYVYYRRLLEKVTRT